MPAAVEAAGAGRDARVELMPSKGLIVAMLAMGGLLTLLGAAGLIAISIGRETGDSLVAMVVVLVMGGALELIVLPMLLSPRPVVVADARGLHYLPRLGKGESFAWSDLAAIGYVRAGKHTGLGLWMRDREAWIATQPGWQQPLLRVGKFLSRSDRRLSVFCTGGAIREFAASVAQRFPVECRE